MYLHSSKVYKCNDHFYQEGAIFKGHIRSTMADAWREYTSLRAYKYHQCPKAIRRTFKEDYQAFKERWGNQDIYVRIVGAYDNEVNMGQFQVELPVYKIEDGKIKKIYIEKRGWYPLGILEVVPCTSMPREEGSTIEPGEKYIDCINKYGRDADMFAALGGVHAERKLNKEDEAEKDDEANITGAGKSLTNMYNLGYNYDKNKVIPVQTPEEHLVECINR